MKRLAGIFMNFNTVRRKRLLKFSILNFQVLIHLKRLIGICILLNVALLLWRCNKNRSDQIKINFHGDCYAGSFTFKKFGDQVPVDALQLPDNSYCVLTKLNSNCSIYRFDSHGLLMSKTSTVTPNKSSALNFLSTSDGGYIISSATDLSDFISTSSNYHSLTSIYAIGNSASQCNLYTVNRGNVMSYYSARNLCSSYITKIDSKGAIIWSKSFGGNSYTGSSLAQLGNSFLYLENRSNLTDSIVHGVADTLKLNYAKHNTLILHNIDFNGNSIWDKEFDNVSGVVNYNQIYGSYVPPLQATVKTYGTNILVQSGFDVYFWNTAGTILGHSNFSNYYCSIAYPNNYISIAFAATLDQNSYSILMPLYGNTDRILSYDFNNRLLNSIPVSAINYDSPVHFIEDANNDFALYDGLTLVRIHKNGVNFLTQPPALNGNTNLLLPTCDNGLMLSGVGTADSSGNFSMTALIVKTDKNGKF